MARIVFVALLFGLCGIAVVGAAQKKESDYSDSCLALNEEQAHLDNCNLLLDLYKYGQISYPAKNAEREKLYGDKTQLIYSLAACLVAEHAPRTQESQISQSNHKPRAVQKSEREEVRENSKLLNQMARCLTSLPQKTPKPKS